MSGCATMAEISLANQSILNYCTSGDLDSLRRCSSDIDEVVHNTFQDGQTCLIAACRNGHKEVAEYLIDKCGADVEQVGVVEFESEQVEGVPPLWCAAAAGHLPVVELLVSRGADVNRTTITNSTALRAACFDGHERVVRFLVDHGANVEIPNRHGHTCLMISCYRRHDQIVEFLLDRKARVNRRSAKGNTALHDCAESGNLKGLQLLLEHRAIMRRDEYGQSPIMSGANAAFKKARGVLFLLVVIDHLYSCDGTNVLYENNYRASELLPIITFLLRSSELVFLESIYCNKIPLLRVHSLVTTTVPDSVCEAPQYSAHRWQQTPFGTKQKTTCFICIYLTVVWFYQCQFLLLLSYLQIVDYLTALSDSLSCDSSEVNISIHEKIAAYELLGASLFDRHSLVQDAIAAWFQALKLRQVACTYPKQVLSVNPQCRCPVSDSLAATDNNLPESSLASGSRRGSSEVFGTNWSLVSLAAREAVHMSDSALNVRTIGVSSDNSAAGLICASCCRAESPLPEGCATFRDVNLAVDLYTAKQIALQNELYAAYLKELRRADFPASSRTSRPPAFGSNDDLVDGDGQSACFPSTSVTDSTPLPCPIAPLNPVVGLMQPGTPADPLRCREPVCWECPRFRRYPLGPTPNYTTFSRPNASTHSVSPNARTLPSAISQCFSCGQIVIRFGTRYPLIQKATSHSSLQPTSDPVPRVTAQNFEASSTVASIHDDHQKSTTNAVSSCRQVLQTTKIPCFACSHLASESHPLIRRLRQCGEEAFGHVREFASNEELTELLRSAHALRLQPLLIRLRILGPDHPDTIYFIRYRGAIYADADNFRQCLHLWRYALELQRVFLEPLCHVSQAAFVSFAELFQYVLTNNYSGLPAVDLDPTLIVDCLELAVDNIERGMDYSFYRWHRRYPWSYTMADKEATNLMRLVALCLHFIAMILTHYLPEPKALPIFRPLRRASTGWPPLMANIPTPDPMADVAEAPVTEASEPIPVAEPPRQPSIDSVVASRMHSAMSEPLKQRFLNQASIHISLNLDCNLYVSYLGTRCTHEDQDSLNSQIHTRKANKESNLSIAEIALNV
ncbi:hypothetical protein P879_02499 [Paragonimus westermani]|uniref:Uncharacterized protein n=1 Tax=Paragonimus westermani TaxID=34504 RepID=A0A8T0DSR3_9TREM|nr:hypothetical protein P879_02499 [Paragonimus westermani]